MDECETLGSPITILFERIRESGTALIFFSDEYPESCWCLDELVVIKKQMELGSLVPFPVFYNVRAHNVKSQTGSFGNTLLRTEDLVRKKVDQGIYKSILETEALIWERRQALVSIGGRIGFSHKHTTDDDFLNKLVVKVKELVDKVSSPGNDLTIIEKPLVPPREAVTSLSHALIDDAVSLSTDHLVILDLNSLKNPVLAQQLTETGQAGSTLLVLLGSLKDNCSEGSAFKPLLFPKKSLKFTGNKPVVSSQEIQDQSYSLQVQVTNVVAVSESNDNFQNRLGEDKRSHDAMTCYSFLCTVMKGLAMMISPPSRTVFISFGEKHLDKTLLSFLKSGLESNQIIVYAEDETKERLTESKVAIVVFSAKYPESQQCLDELVEIKKLMEAGEIIPFPIFYDLKAESVQKVTGWFRLRLLKREEEVRENVNRGNEKSTLDTEARISGWRQALLSISSRPGLAYQHSSDAVFVNDVINKVKDLFANRQTQKNLLNKITDHLVVENTLMHRQETTAIATAKSLNNDLFYSLSSFLQALNLELTDLESFKKMSNGLASMSLKGHTNLVFLNLNSLENLVQFQNSDTFRFLQKGFALHHSSVSRFEDFSG
ncbi:hypothetical protein Bca52824_094234 [Brassica carinata]|uniref:TIR domain-containing protein n=1 Tax=Brassica carinata TaxID=52824 RepID=A0A8X7P5Y8_BRACI|nr:hypothetical protein Bca52824_094234 [Brassica carinata]